MTDDCGDCQSGYCYDYVTHQVSFGACDGPTQMYVVPNDPMNPYWNQSCTDCAGTVNGDAVEDNCGVSAGDNSSCTDC